MTVKDLKARLEKLPPNAVVWFCGPDEDDGGYDWEWKLGVSLNHKLKRNVVFLFGTDPSAVAREDMAKEWHE